MDLLTLTTPFGPMALAGEGAFVTRLYLPNEAPPSILCHETPVLAEARAQLLAYLSGERRAFSLPLRPAGTPFQLAVWEALKAIPWGELRTYGQIAAAIGRPKAVRAVGQANHRNPIPIFIPCHRVVGAGGKLTGYGGGLDLKEKLLDLEHRKE